MNIMHKQIINIFMDIMNAKKNGLWFSGIKNEGEFKKYHKNGKLKIHSFYKKGYKDGEYKSWYNNGIQEEYKNYKFGNLNGEFKTWYYNGPLHYHVLYKNNKIIKDYFK